MLKVHKSKAIQEVIAISIDYWIEVFQPEDPKAGPISGPESPTEQLSCLIENLLKLIVPCLATYVKYDGDILNDFYQVSLIPERFTKEFIINSIRFILKITIFFYSKMFYWVFGTAMVTKCAPPYACLSIGYQEETKRFTQELPKYFSIEESNKFSNNTWTMVLFFDQNI